MKHSRRGVLNPLVLLTLVIFVGALAVAVDFSNLWTTRTEMQRAADSAALSAAQVLVDDACLRFVPGEMQEVLAEAALQANGYANANLVFGTPLQLQPNPENDADGDIVFGHLDGPRSRQFLLAERMDDLGNEDLHLVNAVRIMARRTRARGNPAGFYWARLLKLESADVLATATALLDHSVFGFRPTGSIRVPLAPIALLSDPTRSVPQSWEAQVENSRGVDEFRYDRNARCYLPDTRGDGLFEMTVTIALTPTQGEATNSCLLSFGATDIAGVCRQLTDGLAAADLDSFGGELIIGSGGTLTVSGGLIAGGASGDSAELAAVLQTLADQATPRVWPLFADFDYASGQATVTRFVAARVVSVFAATEENPLRFVLQPCMLATGTALTRIQPANGNVAPIWNRYVCKVRLVD